jgi:hypothetical protein
MTSAPTDPPIRAAINATGSNLLVKIIALLLLAKDQVLLEYSRACCKHYSSMSGDLKNVGKCGDSSNQCGKKVSCNRFTSEIQCLLTRYGTHKNADGIRI